MNSAAPRSWIAAIHRSRNDIAPTGTGLVLDERRILTSAHVAGPGGLPSEDLWVAFPFAGPDGILAQARVRQIRQAAARQADLAVLDLESPIPPGVTPARLRCPPPETLEGLRWQAFGFPDGEWKGNDAHGTFGPALGYGWVRLDTQSRYPVAQGFSGGGLWCPDYEAVIAVVGAANNRGDGQALTLHYADRFLPEEKIVVLAGWSVRATDEIAQRAWGWQWTLAGDQEADRHWRPRARGVMSAAEAGHRFRGRETALREIISWLDRPVPDRKVLIVTGSPGAGKSAVLGRIVVTAEGETGSPGARAEEEDGIRATAGSVSCAVHVKGKTALDVAREIARAASAPLSQQAEDLPAMLAAVLAGRAGRFNLIVDALDEASDPAQARAIVRDLLLPIAVGRAGTSAQIVVGTRRFDGDGDLLGAFGSTVSRIDLDEPAYFEVADLAAYAQATLQLRGTERPDNPYQPDAVAEPVARRIAELADRNFLIAALVARTHGLYDRKPVAAGELRFSPSVDDALTAYLNHLPPVDGVPATDVLAALAYLHAPGVPIGLWHTAVHALTQRTVNEDSLRKFAQTSAANFLIESTGQTDPVYRLFHQALNDTLSNRPAPADDETAITKAFIDYGRRHGWRDAPPYLLRSLPDHAHRTGLVDDLLTDTDYTLHADLRRLIPAAATATIAVEAVSLLHRTPSAVTADPAERLAQFSVTEALDNLDTGYRRHPGPAPYRAVWAGVAPRSERTILTGHTGAVNAMCSFRLNGKEVLATASNDRTVRIWDPSTGTELQSLTGHVNGVEAICPVHLDGQVLLATSSWTEMLIWDPATGTRLRSLTGPTNAVGAVCPINIDGRELLATASWTEILIWDPATGTRLRSLTDPTNAVGAVCPINIDGRELLATASWTEILIWDPATGTRLRSLTGHPKQVTALCPIHVDGRNLLASGSHHETVRIWDPATGTLLRSLTGGSHLVNAMCSFPVDGRETVAFAAQSGGVQMWDPAGIGTRLGSLTGHTGPVNAVCAIPVGGRELLATAGQDQTVRIWDPADRTRPPSPDHHPGQMAAMCPVWVKGQDLLATAGPDDKVRLSDPATGTLLDTLAGDGNSVSPVSAICLVQVYGRELLAVAHWSGTVRIWDPAAKTELRPLVGHAGWVKALCPIQVNGRNLLASVGWGGTVWIWDPATGTSVRRFHHFDRTNQVNAVCPIEVDGRELLATGDVNSTVRIWDPATGTELRSLTGHRDGVNALCPIQWDGPSLLASGSHDHTVGIWDPATGTLLRSLTGHTRGVNAVCSVRANGHALLASAGADQTVRIWDLATGSALISIPTYVGALAVATIADRLVVGLATGLLSIQLTPGLGVTA